MISLLSDGAALVLLTLGAPVPPAACTAAPADPAAGARQIFEAALAAHGGRNRLAAVRDVTADVNGSLHMLGQSSAIEGPLDIERARIVTTFDRGRNRLVQDATNDYPADFTLVFRQVARADSGFVIDLRKNFQGGHVDRPAGQPFAPNRAAFVRQLGPFLLLDAVDRNIPLRQVAGARVGTQCFDVVELNDGAGALRVLFDPATHLLARYETRTHHPLAGALRVTTTFDAYGDVRGLRLPAERHDFRNDAPSFAGHITWTLDRAPADSLFSLPPGYVEAPVPVADPIRKIADGVYTVAFLDGTTGMAVEFRDYVVMIEAPTASSVAEAAIAAITKTVPGKPIRYVTFTHHHTDHVGGLRAYIVRGIPIVTTPAFRPFVERLATLDYSVAPDSLSRTPRAPRLETFTGRRVFTDGRQTLELYDLGRTSHTPSSLFAYVRGPGIVYDGDAVVIPSDAPVQPALTLEREFARTLDRLGLANAISVIINTHVGAVTPERFREAVAMPSPPRASAP